MALERIVAITSLIAISGCASRHYETFSSKIRLNEEQQVRVLSQRLKYEKNGKRAVPDWVYLLDDRPIKDFSEEREKIETIGIPCGPRSIGYVLKKFGINEGYGKISKMRRENELKKFLGFFSKSARNITFPWELKSILRKYGLDVETFSGRSANLKKVVEEYKKGREVIVRVSLGGFFDQHYAVFDPLIIKKTQEMAYHDGTPLKSPIYEVYSIFKR